MPLYAVGGREGERAGAEIPINKKKRSRSLLAGPAPGLALLAGDDLLADLLPGRRKPVKPPRIQGAHLPRRLGKGLGSVLADERLGRRLDLFAGQRMYGQSFESKQESLMQNGSSRRSH